MTSLAAPPVSIGLPVYNGERYLDGAIRSILEQTFADFELVISDNASEDATEEICREFARNDTRIRYVRARQNQGAAWNFNAVARLASAELFRFQSHDDLCEPTLLERCLEARHAVPDAVLWFPKALEIDSHDRVVGDFSDTLQLLEPTPHERIASFFKRHRTANALYGLMRRSALLSARPLGSYHSADTILLAELALRGRFIEVPEPLFLRRVHPEMSHAGRTDAEVERWWDPGTRRTHSLRRSKMFLHLLLGTWVAPLPVRDRLRAQSEVVAYWGGRYWRHMLGELRRAGVEAIARRVNRSHDGTGAS